MRVKFGTRKMWRVGNNPSSLVTSLPKVWVETNNIDTETKIKMEMNDEGHLIIKPIGEEESE